MKRAPIDDEVREAFEEIALEVFADMTNAGATFQQALVAIYLSGIQHAVAASSREQHPQSTSE